MRDGAGVRLGVVLLCHSNLAMAARMARIWLEGGARLAIHIDAKVPAAEVEKMQKALAGFEGVLYTPRHRCDWGRFSLVQATQDAATHLLADYPDTTHVYLASGACLPLRDVSELIGFLALDPRCDHIESVSAHDVGWTVGGLNEERFTLYFPFDWRRQRQLFDRFVALQRRRGVHRKMPRGLAPHLGSQWWCLTAATLRAILDEPRRVEFDSFFRSVWIPDESYFQTLARRYSVRIESRSLTMAKFDHKGRPYQFYDDHIPLLEESRCFVARKMWAGATALQNHFPRPVSTDDQVLPPDPVRIERLINRTVRRRVYGRPGLYMQSRFPRKDAENGKTSAPYAVFQGLNDLYPQFNKWLARHVTADVHGHLFAPDEVEFARGAKVGPGAISSSAAVRDRDPQGFLTALIRITQKMQVFQFSPRDNQSLNWFMATDPNAHIFVVTGAWMLPLLHSGMPFDNIRRMAARLQGVELRQLDVLNSVWVKARVQIWDMTDFLARPQALLDNAFWQIDPNAELVRDLPDMRDMAGLEQLLLRLRNAGLRPLLTGDLNGLAPVPQSERNSPK